MSARRNLLAVIGALCVAIPSGVAAKEFKFNLFQPPRTLEGKVFEDFFPELAKATNNGVVGKIFAGGQLLNGPGTLKGIKDGVVDGGFVVPGMNLGELRHIAMVPDMLPWAPYSQAAAAAASQTILVDSEECKQEQKDLNIWFFGSIGPTPWNIMCTKPVQSLADFKGRKVRVTGSSATRLIRAFGGVAVLLPPTEIGSALSGGQIDCAVGPNAWMADYALWDTVKQVIDMDLGVYHGLGLFVTNRNSFAAFTPQEKKAYLSLAIKWGVTGTDRYVEQQREVREMATKRGVQFWKPGKDFTDALAKFRKDDLPRLAEDFKGRGVADPEKLIQSHLAALDKWEKIVEKTGTDRAALEKAIQEEIYDKIKY